MYPTSTKSKFENSQQPGKKLFPCYGSLVCRSPVDENCCSYSVLVRPEIPLRVGEFSRSYLRYLCCVVSLLGATLASHRQRKTLVHEQELAQVAYSEIREGPEPRGRLDGLAKLWTGSMKQSNIISFFE